MQDTEKLVPHLERDAEHRLDAFLPQDWVEDVRVVDVLDHDRRARRRDAAREALADRDADALLDLLLQPARGAGDQHLLVFVEQEDGNRIHVQDALYPKQVVDEQLLERALGPL